MSVTVVIPCCFNCWYNGSPAAIVLRSKRYKVAPEHKVVKHSEIEASKLNDANCNVFLFLFQLKLSIWAVTRVHKPWCSNNTPLGFPVEPEV